MASVTKPKPDLRTAGKGDALNTRTPNIAPDHRADGHILPSGARPVGKEETKRVRNLNPLVSLKNKIVNKFDAVVDSFPQGNSNASKTMHERGRVTNSGKTRGLGEEQHLHSNSFSSSSHERPNPKISSLSRQNEIGTPNGSEVRVGNVASSELSGTNGADSRLNSSTGTAFHDEYDFVSDKDYPKGQAQPHAASAQRSRVRADPDHAKIGRLPQETFMELRSVLMEYYDDPDVHAYVKQSLSNEDFERLMHSVHGMIREQRGGSSVRSKDGGSDIMSASGRPTGRSTGVSSQDGQQYGDTYSEVGGIGSGYDTGYSSDYEEHTRSRRHGHSRRAVGVAHGVDGRPMPQGERDIHARGSVLLDTVESNRDDRRGGDEKGKEEERGGKEDGEGALYDRADRFDPGMSHRRIPHAQQRDRRASDSEYGSASDGGRRSRRRPEVGKREASASMDGDPYGVPTFRDTDGQQSMYHDRPLRIPNNESRGHPLREKYRELEKKMQTLLEENKELKGTIETQKTELAEKDALLQGLEREVQHLQEKVSDLDGAVASGWKENLKKEVRRSALDEIKALDAWSAKQERTFHLQMSRHVEKLVYSYDAHAAELHRNLNRVENQTFLRVAAKFGSLIFSFGAAGGLLLVSFFRSGMSYLMQYAEENEHPTMAMIVMYIAQFFSFQTRFQKDLSKRLFRFLQPHTDTHGEDRHGEEEVDSGGDTRDVGRDVQRGQDLLRNRSN